MKAIFSKCYDDWGNLKDNALNIAYNLGKKEGLRKDKKIARAKVIDNLQKLDYCTECEKQGDNVDCYYCRVNDAQQWYLEQLKENK